MCERERKGERRERQRKKIWSVFSSTVVYVTVYNTFAFFERSRRRIRVKGGREAEEREEEEGKKRVIHRRGDDTAAGSCRGRATLTTTTLVNKPLHVAQITSPVRVSPPGCTRRVSPEAGLREMWLANRRCGFTWSPCGEAQPGGSTELRAPEN